MRPNRLQHDPPLQLATPPQPPHGATFTHARGAGKSPQIYILRFFWVAVKLLWFMIVKWGWLVIFSGVMWRNFAFSFWVSLFMGSISELAFSFTRWKGLVSRVFFLFDFYFHGFLHQTWLRVGYIVDGGLWAVMVLTLDEYWDRVLMGERYGVDHPFFEMVASEVCRMVLSRHSRMVEAVMVGGGYSREDIEQELRLGLVVGWDRLDWSMGRRACFWYLVSCGVRVLQQLYRRYRDRPGWVSLDGLLGAWMAEELGEEEAEMLSRVLLRWDPEVLELLGGEL